MIRFIKERDTPGFSAASVLCWPLSGRRIFKSSPRYAEASDFYSQKSVYVWIRIAQVAAHFYPRKRKKEALPHLHLHLSPFVFIGFGEVSPAGFIRSLNRRTDALERRLYSFHANKLRSLACATPHGGDASFVCPLPYRSWIRILAFHTNKSTTRKGPCFGRRKASVAFFILFPL